VHEHLNVILQYKISNSIFQETFISNLNPLLWNVPPFTAEDFDFGNVTSELIYLRSDLVQNTEIRIFINTLIFWHHFLPFLDIGISVKKLFDFLGCMQLG